MKPPKVEERPPDILSDRTLSAILATAGGCSFEDRRDAALLALLADTGARASEIAGLVIDEVNLDLEVIPKPTPYSDGQSVEAVFFGVIHGGRVRRCANR
jgi:site-specific recombinase XerD